jgi:hypothetical protein
LFTGEEPPWKLDAFRVFGSPIYVLQKHLQDGDSFRKWKARSWQGAYVGHSTCHASNVPLVYNYHTTHVSPQYQLIFDEDFTSILHPTHTQTNAFLEKIYNSTSWHHHSPYSDDDDEYFFDSFGWIHPLLLDQKTEGESANTSNYEGVLYLHCPSRQKLT